MGDRRQGDRREPEQGVIKVQTKHVVCYSVLIGILVISIICNVILCVKNAKLQEEFDDLLANYNEDYYVYDEDYDEDYSEDYEETNEVTEPNEIGEITEAPELPETEIAE